MAFEEDLESLSNTFSKDEEEKALKRRFEQSKLWEEHRKWHEEQGTAAHLAVWEEPAQEVPKEPAQLQADEPMHHKTIKVGGCDCQPKIGLFQLDHRGEVILGIPPPVAEQSAYNAASPEMQSYNAAGTPETQYNAGSGQNKELYR